MCPSLSTNNSCGIAVGQPVLTPQITEGDASLSMSHSNLAHHAQRQARHPIAFTTGMSLTGISILSVLLRRSCGQVGRLPAWTVVTRMLNFKTEGHGSNQQAVSKDMDPNPDGSSFPVSGLFSLGTADGDVPIAIAISPALPNQAIPGTNTSIQQAFEDRGPSIVTRHRDLSQGFRGVGLGVLPARPRRSIVGRIL